MCAESLTASQGSARRVRPPARPGGDGCDAGFRNSRAPAPVNRWQLWSHLNGSLFPTVVHPNLCRAGKDLLVGFGGIEKQNGVLAPNVRQWKTMGLFVQPSRGPAFRDDGREVVCAVCTSGFFTVQAGETPSRHLQGSFAGGQGQGQGRTGPPPGV